MQVLPGLPQPVGGGVGVERRAGMGIACRSRTPVIAGGYSDRHDPPKVKR